MYIRFQDVDHISKTRYISNNMIAGDHGALCADLFSAGMVIARNQYLNFAAYLALVKVKSRVITVDRTGWHNIKDRWHFVLPKETIGPSSGERVIMKEVGVDYYQKRGTLADWQAGIGTLAKGEGSLILNICSALVASLAHITGINVSGLNVVDDTSKGKSTCQYAGATVWDKGGKGGFVQPWNSTINGLEAMATLFNHTMLSLDDMNQGTPQVISEALYMIHLGVGKVRMEKTRALQETNKWSTFVMSSSEQSIEVRLREAGIKIRGGQDVRLPEIPGDRGHGVGAFDKPKTKAEAAAFAEKVESASKKAYGTVGPEFERRIIEAGVEEIATRGRGYVAEFIKKHIKASANEQVHRAAKTFALIALAGELLIEFKIAPWDKYEGPAAGKWGLKQWITIRGGTGSSEAKRQIAQIREHIEKRRFDGFASPKTGGIPEHVLIPAYIPTPSTPRSRARCVLSKACFPVRRRKYHVPKSIFQNG